MTAPLDPITVTVLGVIIAILFPIVALFFTIIALIQGQLEAALVFLVIYVLFADDGD